MFKNGCPYTHVIQKNKISLERHTHVYHNMTYFVVITTYYRHRYSEIKSLRSKIQLDL